MAPGAGRQYKAGQIIERINAYSATPPSPQLKIIRALIGAASSRSRLR